MQYRALQQIRKNGQDTAPGELVDLIEQDAAPLLSCGAIEPAYKRFSRPAVTPAATDQAASPGVQITA